MGLFLHIQIQHHADRSCLTLAQATSIVQFFTEHIEITSKAQPAWLQSTPRGYFHLVCFDKNKHLLCLESHLNVMCFTQHKGLLDFPKWLFKKTQFNRTSGKLYVQTIAVTIILAAFHACKYALYISHIQKFLALSNAEEKLHPYVLNT